MRRRYEKTWFLLAILSFQPPANGQIWVEPVDADAGTLPGTSQRTRGAETLDFILGRTSPDDVVDMYCIQITDPSGPIRSASSSASGDASIRRVESS